MTNVEDDWNDLDANQLRALGLVAFWAGRVEIELSDLTAELVAPGGDAFQPDPIASAIVAGMSFSPLADLADRLNATRADPRYFELVAGSIKTARTWMTKRNEFLHGSWFTSGEPGRATVVTQRRSGMVASGDISFSEILDVAGELADSQASLYSALLEVRVAWG